MIPNIWKSSTSPTSFIVRLVLLFKHNSGKVGGIKDKAAVKTSIFHPRLRRGHLFAPSVGLCPVAICTTAPHAEQRVSAEQLPVPVLPVPGRGRGRRHGSGSMRLGLGRLEVQRLEE